MMSFSYRRARTPDTGETVSTLCNNRNQDKPILIKSFRSPWFSGLFHLLKVSVYIIIAVKILLIYLQYLSTPIADPSELLSFFRTTNEYDVLSRYYLFVKRFLFNLTCKRSGWWRRETRNFERVTGHIVSVKPRDARIFVSIYCSYINNR